VTGAGLQGVAQAFTVGFNTELVIQLGNLSQLFPSTDIIGYDTFSFMNDVVANPAGYGFSNSQDACLPSILAAPCTDPGSYIFWDGFHPTTQADALIASAFARAVPEPGTIALLVVGMFALSAAGRKRRKLGHARMGV
jgi:phospholipase/lecithinase/hemolysin